MSMAGVTHLPLRDFLNLGSHKAVRQSLYLLLAKEDKIAACCAVSANIRVFLAHTGFYKSPKFSDSFSDSVSKPLFYFFR